MGKNGAQGGRWEAEVSARFARAGMLSARHPKRGIKGEPDVWAGSPTSAAPILAVFWKRYIKNKGKRRTSSKMVVVSYDDFMRMVEMLNHSHEVSYQIQCKAAEKISANAVLRQLEKGWEEWQSK